MEENITLLVAFLAGLASFLSPCVLPMVPIYLASLYGPDIFESKGFRLAIFLHSLCFVLGFTVIFVFLGVIVGITGHAIIPDYNILRIVAGSLMIAFGVFILLAMVIPWLNFERRLRPAAGKTTGFLRSFIIGGSFSLGWTACIGPVLGSILTMASVKATAWQGAYLLAVYSLGLGLPFLILGAAFDVFQPLIKRIQRYSWIIQIISALLLLTVGVLLILNKLALISAL
ncbi:MAG: cytochrome c biogenesis CcdA family protein [Dehalococcoidales bacterium]|nr:cytochrome c biogenesis CcdA family protein [Dehalococcoidales bacterium]